MSASQTLAYSTPSSRAPGRSSNPNRMPLSTHTRRQPYGTRHQPSTTHLPCHTKVPQPPPPHTPTPLPPPHPHPPTHPTTHPPQTPHPTPTATPTATPTPTPTPHTHTQVQWLASMFNMPSVPGRPDLCDEKAAAGAGARPRPRPPPPTCEQRFSVFHCHILPHEDEGCIWPVNWFCPTNATAANPFPLGVCPTSYPPCPPPGAAAATAGMRPDKTTRRSLRSWRP